MVTWPVAGDDDSMTTCLGAARFAGGGMHFPRGPYPPI